MLHTAFSPPSFVPNTLLQAYGWDTMFLGSVADYATQRSKFPVRGHAECISEEKLRTSWSMASFHGFCCDWRSSSQ